MKKFLLLLFLFIQVTLCKAVTIYSENFSTNNGKGQVGSTLDTSGVTTWSINVANAVTMSGTDHFSVANNRFESFNTDAPSQSSPVYWYSQSFAGYTNITFAAELGRVSSNSGSGVEAFYTVDGGSTWVSFGTLIGSASAPVSASVSGISVSSGQSVQIRIAHWGTSSTPTYYHDNVTISGDLACTPPTTALTLSIDEACENTTSVALSGGTAPSGAQTASWSATCGACVSGSTFNPSLAGVGEHIISYTLDDAGCLGVATDVFTVVEVPIAEIVSPSSDLCSNYNRTLVGFPSGGIFSVLSGPATISGDVLTPSGTGTVTIQYVYGNGLCFDTTTQSINVISSCIDNVYVGAWDALNFYSAAPCTWAPQDGVYLGTITHPYASVQAGVDEVDNIINSTLVFLPDAYVGSYDYDADGNDESCTGSQVANVFNITSADNGLKILGVDGGCGTLLDLSEGGSSTTDFVVASGVNGLTIKDMYFKSWGQVIELSGCTNVLIENCVFDDCDHGEPAVLIDNCSNMVFKNCTFVNSLSTSGYKQTEITGTSTNITFSSCIWSCNEDPGNEGGAVLVECDGTVNFDDCIFAGNVSNGTSGDGGAMTIQKRTGGVTSPTVNFYGGSFTKNVSEATTGTVGGGAINIKDGKVTIDGTHFYGNKATANGGAILFSEKTEPLTIKNAIFEADTAGGNGGALYISNETTVHIYNSYFFENRAASGGAIYVNAGPEGQTSAGIETVTNIYNTSIYNNTSTGSSAGGVFYNASDNNENSDAVPNSDSFLISSSKIWGNNSTGTYKDVEERYYWCTFCSGSLADPALIVDSTTVIGSGNAFSFGYGSENVILSHGDTSSTVAGWSGTYTAPQGTDINCGAGYCALTIPGSCFAVNYSETSVSICTDTSFISSLSGQVWIDANQDGIQSVSEVGHADVNNVAVLLVDENGYQIGFTLTDANGNYAFNNLPAGNYTIKIQNPNVSTYGSLTTIDQAGSTESTDNDAKSVINDTIISGFNLVGGIIEVSLGASENKTDLDAGFISNLGTISGLVFMDTLVDGSYVSEPLLENVWVGLYSCGENQICGDADDRLVDSMYTSASGSYSFTDLPLNNTYYVLFNDVVLGDTTTYYRTTQLNPGNHGLSTIDSDADVSSGLTADVLLSNDITAISNLNEGLSVVPPMVLPVELFDFEYKLTDNCEVILNWTTYTEINNDYFKVLKSDDGHLFIELEKISGRGNSSELNHYTCIDKNLDGKQVYYKLQQFDFDGKQTNLKIIACNSKCSIDLPQIQVQPNPFEDFLSVQISNLYSDGLSYEIYNTAGQLIYQNNQDYIDGKTTFTINTSRFTTGIYFIKIYSDLKSLGVYKLIKN